MTTDPDDIIERLTKRREFQINLGEVFNANDLENAIKKSFDDDSRRNTLERNKGILFDTAKTKDSVVDNSIRAIDESKSLRDLDATFDNVTASIGDIGRINELKIETAQAEKQRELTKETPEDLTKEEIFGLGLQSVRKLSSELGLPVDDTKELLVDKGFTLIANDKRFKK